LGALPLCRRLLLLAHPATPSTPSHLLQVQPWKETLSGGEQQRLAMAVRGEEWREGEAARRRFRAPSSLPRPLLTSAPPSSTLPRTPAPPSPAPLQRLLFHRPRFAILDECTSAVSADGEERLISEAVQRGITMLSIGHRPALRRFHSVAVHFEGSGIWRLEEMRGSDVEGLAEAPPPGVDSHT
jgi:hypothetical protein